MTLTAGSIHRMCIKNRFDRFVTGLTSGLEQRCATLLFFFFGADKCLKKFACWEVMNKVGWLGISLTI